MELIFNFYMCFCLYEIIVRAFACTNTAYFTGIFINPEHGIFGSFNVFDDL